MAMVDFSNAKISVDNSSSNPPSTQLYANVDAFIGWLNDANNNHICTNKNVTQVVNQDKKLVAAFTGTFTASGTEFYLRYDSGGARWKVSNISFQSGDTYSFQIPIEIICN